MPVTIILQGLSALVATGFGAAALAAVRHEGGFPQRYRRTWRTTGVALLLIGVWPAAARTSPGCTRRRLPGVR